MTSQPESKTSKIMESQQTHPIPTDIEGFTQFALRASREVIAAHLATRDVAPELVPAKLRLHLILLVKVTARMNDYGPVSQELRKLAEVATETLGLIREHEKEMAYREFLRERSAALSADGN